MVSSSSTNLKKELAKEVAKSYKISL